MREAKVGLLQHAPPGHQESQGLSTLYPLHQQIEKRERPMWISRRGLGGYQRLFMPDHSDESL
eukprot:1153679-Pelagomonas_calceolata.AAC.1